MSGPADQNADARRASAPPEEAAPGGTTRWEHAVGVTLGVVLLAVLGGGVVGAAGLWRDPAWAAAARRTWRIRGTFVADTSNPEVRTRYAAELLKLATASPTPLRTYFDWRSERHCEYVIAHTPPGTFASCRQQRLDRLRQRGEGEKLVAAARSELDGAPPQWIPHLHRYAGQGAVMQADWDLAREEFALAYSFGGHPRDALRTAWVCLHSGQPAVALDWLDRAFEANSGYPPPYRAAVASAAIRLSERERYLAAIDAEAAFYDACRQAAHARIGGEPAPIPDWPREYVQL